MGNFTLWWLLFDDEFKQRIEIYEEAYREQMKRENEEFVDKMQDIIELDPEAVELTGFGNKWHENLECISKLREEAQDMRKRTVCILIFRGVNTGLRREDLKPSALFGISMKPKPRERPVSRNLMMFTDAISP